jgi:4-amino-4-deoxy-L-arabinose transferase-like glycosyltransferase
MKKYYWIILLAILLFGFILRFVGLDTNPPHLGNDEISIAFDTYSIRLIGKDEHGHFLPISFESHRSYKAPLYAYFNIPFNIVFGNNEYGIRALSAIAGTVSIYLSALLGTLIAGPNVGLITAVLMATNPKNIFASRIGFESNLATTVMLFGIWGLLKYVDSRKKIWLFVGGFFMGLSIWGYHTEWGLVPMILACIPIIFRKSIPIKNWFWTLLIAIIVSLPVYYNFITVQKSDSNNRATSQLWFSGGQFKDYLNNSNDSKVKKTLKVFTTPIYSYIEHFSLNVNFTTGSDLFNVKSPLSSGWFLLTTLPMIFFGLYFGKNLFGRWWIFLITWWILCPIIPATAGSISSVRNLPFIVPTSLIMAGGCLEICRLYFRLRYLLLFVFTINLVIFFVAFFIHFPLDSGNNFQYGYKQAWEFIKPNVTKYDKVVVEDRFGDVGQYTGVPHLYFGYFGAFTVNDMQARHEDSGLAIGKFRFKYVDWNKEIYMPNTVYIVSAINPKAGPFYNKLVQIGMIRNLDYKPQFLIYETIK